MCFRAAPVTITSATMVLSFIVILPGIGAIFTASAITKLSNLSVPAKKLLRDFQSEPENVPLTTSNDLTSDSSFVPPSLNPAALTASFNVAPVPAIEPLTFTESELVSYSTEIVISAAGILNE